MKNREAIWPWAAFVGALAGWLAGRGRMLPAGWWVVPWVLSLGFFGLPHGAVDHEVLRRLWRPAPNRRWALGAILAGYLAAASVGDRRLVRRAAGGCSRGLSS